ncbi:EAL domain-containing protein [Duganella sp. FT92W]|uniref:EAL domain-containing protein n=1 Tax=Pseudoduganella rivuli TaxID=2666085 RepID=A0A7X2LTM5_9BURK|nr:EAL domain-containing protein [Pseudoduganella rivuli]MRV72137.1 EAL domain-containing protein [Pseudoduganella rivuli]
MKTDCLPFPREDILAAALAPPSGPASGDSWRIVRERALRASAVDEAAGLGRWWYEHRHGRLYLSAVAASLLGIAASGCHEVADALLNVAPQDAWRLRSTLDAITDVHLGTACEFRVNVTGKGTRWLKVQPVAREGEAIVAGMVVDITSTKHAAMRERFSFALTQYLIGTDTFDAAIHKIIQLVCDELGWDWGAFWVREEPEGRTGVLRCRHVWHAATGDYSELRAVTTTASGDTCHGVLGQVWSGKAQWVDASTDTEDGGRFASARRCGLQSGYFFPVTYTGGDGGLHSAGILEFFSREPRQREAQLPGLAESISALIAQTAQRMAQQERMRVLAQTDEMTGLVNRAHFHYLLDRACEQCPPCASFGVLYIDLDQFKPINDAFGHAAGNVVLKAFAERLRELAPEGAVVARLGGDEFAMMTGYGLEPQAVEALAQRVAACAREQFQYMGHELSVSASIGISMYPSHGANTAQLLHAADAAMYASKRNGRNRVSHYSDAQGAEQDVLAKQLIMLSELQHGFERGEFFLVYQPIMDAHGEALAAVEALIRWRKSDGTIVPPDQFIPVAEQSRLIVHLGRWVVQQVCHDLPRLHAAGMHGLKVHINMAAPEFLDSDLPAELMATVRAAGIDPSSLQIELTENMVMSHIDTSLPIMRKLTQLGFEISLDDFGMGYSSLSLLKTLPIASLKIDRGFLQGVPRERDDCAIVRTMLDLGRNMGIGVIAEGVETDSQLGYLRQFGCTLVQGYLLGRPMPLPQLLERYRKA